MAKYLVIMLVYKNMYLKRTADVLGSKFSELLSVGVALKGKAGSG